MGGAQAAPSARGQSTLCHKGKLMGLYWVCWDAQQASDLSKLFRKHAVFHFKHLILLSVNPHCFQKLLLDQAQASHVLLTELGLTTRLRSGFA